MPMYTPVDYIRWRGCKTLQEYPFNEVDAYILCKLCCLDLEGAVPTELTGENVTIEDAVNEYFEWHDGEKINLGLLMAKEVVASCKLIARAPRYRDMRLFAFTEQIDETAEEQFCALTIDLGDGSLYVTFCGTDDNIIAWKENFNMSYCDEVPAQRDATRYLDMIGGMTVSPLRIGGHSKGGNLSVYAAMNCPAETQDRIAEIYNFDGPGFGRAVIHREDYNRIRDRITTILPQTPLIGVLMEHEENFVVVRSEAPDPFKHNGFRWEVSGSNFVHLDCVTTGGKFLDKRLGSWVDSVDIEQRRAFVNALFDVLQSTGAKTLTDLSTAKLRSTVKIIRTMRSLDPETREALSRTIGLLIRELTTFRKTST